MKNKTRVLCVFCVLIFCVFPALTFAQVRITEVMYDAPGTDSGHEWIEVENISQNSIDLTTWKFLENETNHKINEHTGGVTLAAGVRGIIADKPELFLSDHPDVNVSIFDSAFSLNNSGEELALINADEEAVDTVQYVPVDASAGTGNSLQYISGSWRPGKATPGEANTEIIYEEVKDDSDGDTYPNNGPLASHQVNQVSVIGFQKPLDPGVDYPAGYFHTYYSGILETPLHAVAKVEQEYTFDVLRHRFDMSDLQIEEGRFVWTMGDGTQYDQAVGSRLVHRYEYPGTYVIHAEFYQDYNFLSIEPKLSTSIAVSVASPDIEILNVDFRGAIQLSNSTNFDFDLSDWRLVYGDSVFLFPPKTFIAAGAKLYIPASVTTFQKLHEYGADNPILLLLPSGHLVSSFDGVFDDLDHKEVYEEQLLTTQDPTSFSSDSIPTSEMSAFGTAADNEDERTMPWWVWLITGGILALSLGSMIISRTVAAGRIREWLSSYFAGK